MKPGELSIKIKIADREYPMKVSADKEERIRRAGKILNDKLKKYREQFGIDDKQDLLSMVAFECMVDKMQADEQHGTNSEYVLEKINYLNNLISQEI